MAKHHPLRRLRLGPRSPRRAVVIVDRQGQIAADFECEHTQAGWQSLRDKTAAFPHLAVALETSQGAAVDQLLQSGSTVYPVNPVAAKA